MAANDHSIIRTKTADNNIDYNYQAYMEYCLDENNWFKRFKGEWDMSLEAEALANEIIRLELLQSQGHQEYEVTETVIHVRPIAPRLRELHKLLDETGKGPIPLEHKPNPAAVPNWKTQS